MYLFFEIIHVQCDVVATVYRQTATVWENCDDCVTNPLSPEAWSSKDENQQDLLKQLCSINRLLLKLKTQQNQHSKHDGGLVYRQADFTCTFLKEQTTITIKASTTYWNNEKSESQTENRFPVKDNRIRLKMKGFTKGEEFLTPPKSSAFPSRTTTGASKRINSAATNDEIIVVYAGPIRAQAFFTILFWTVCADSVRV